MLGSSLESAYICLKFAYSQAVKAPDREYKI